MAKASGTSDADIARRLAFLDKIDVDLAAAEGDQQALAMVKADFAQANSDKVTMGISPDTFVAIRTSPLTRQLYAYDHGPALRLLKTPLLALNGSLDVQVPPGENLGAISAAQRGNSQATIVELPNLNHLFQNAKLGTLGEYAEIEETIAPAALKMIGDWVVAQNH